MTNYKKIIAGAAAIAISAGATGTIAYAKNSDKSSSSEKASEEKAISSSDRAALDEAALCALRQQLLSKGCYRK